MIHSRRKAEIEILGGGTSLVEYLSKNVGEFVQKYA